MLQQFPSGCLFDPGEVWELRAGAAWGLEISPWWLRFLWLKLKFPAPDGWFVGAGGGWGLGSCAVSSLKVSSPSVGCPETLTVPTHQRLRFYNGTGFSTHNL